MSDYELMKEMRLAMVNGETDFNNYIQDYNGCLSRKELGKLWYDASTLKKDDNWKRFLCRRMSEALNEFSDKLNELLEEGESEVEIASMLGMDVKTVKQIMIYEH